MIKTGLLLHPQVCYLQVYIISVLGISAVSVVVSGVVLKLHHLPDDIPVGETIVSVVRWCRYILCFHHIGERPRSLKPNAVNTEIEVIELVNHQDSHEFSYKKGDMQHDRSEGQATSNGKEIWDLSTTETGRQVTWQSVAETVDRLCFVTFSLMIAVDMMVVFIYLATADSVQEDGGDGVFTSVLCEAISSGPPK